ncbi:MAG: amidohydrolase family protein [Acidimicrobiales bacterium]
MSARLEIAEMLDHIALVDHHVHGALRFEQTREQFERVITESDRPIASGTSTFDSPIGFAILRWCAPLLDLGDGTTPDQYIERRAALGPDEVNRRFLRAAGASRLLIDTGFAAAELLDIPEMAKASLTDVREVVRLEAMAERLLREGVEPAEFADAVREQIYASVRDGAVGTKSIVAYRHGFHLDTNRPSDKVVRRALETMFISNSAIDTRHPRIEDPVLLSFLLWVGIDAGVPLQIHTGFGDTDLYLHRSDPSLLTDFFKATESIGTPITLLHCYPYHREAGYLAQMFPHVYFDIGEAINYLGAQSRQLVSETFAIAPFAKQLFSSDAWGPSELHFLGAHLWRRAMTNVLTDWVDAGDWTLAQASRVASMVASENAERIYAL